MATRTAITRLNSQPLASSSRIPWTPISRTHSHPRPSAHLRPPRPSTLPISSYRRQASTSAAPHASPNLPPILSRPTIRVTPPSLRAIKEEGYQNDDVVLIPSEEASLIITPEAVRVSLTSSDRDPLAKVCSRSNSFPSHRENRPIFWLKGNSCSGVA